MTDKQYSEAYPQSIDTNPVIIYRSPEIKNGHWFLDGNDTGISAFVTPEIGENGNWYVNGKDTGVDAHNGLVPSVSEDGTWKFGNFKTLIQAKINFDSGLFTGNGSISSPISLYANHEKTIKVDYICDSEQNLPDEGNSAVVKNVAAIYLRNDNVWTSVPIQDAFIVCDNSFGIITKSGYFTILSKELLAALTGNILVPDMSAYVKSSDSASTDEFYIGKFKELSKEQFNSLTFGGFWKPGDTIIDETKFYVIEETSGEYIKGNYVVQFNGRRLQFDSPLTTDIILSDDTRFKSLETRLTTIENLLKVKVLQ